MSERNIWFLRISDGNGKSGIGEVAPIDRLSPESIADVPEQLKKIASRIAEMEVPKNEDDVWAIARSLTPRGFSSIQFGLEVALFDLLNGGSKKVFETDLSTISIPINGLIWMGGHQFMKEQIKQKLDEGYTCIKLKVGSLDFETELSVIKNLRKISKDLIIRLDANGAFQTNEILMKLKQLSIHNIHSIEQPILPMQP